MTTPVTVIEGGVVATMDGVRAEHAPGHLVVRDGLVEAVGPGPAPALDPATPVDRVDARGCLVTPGLVNTHHHLYQWATRGLCVDDGLFGWLTRLYPVWARIDEGVTGAAAAAGLGWLARTGCTTTMDHHYVFPSGGGDVLGATIDAADRIGLRFLATRGSMDLGRSRGGLPPDEVVEDIDTILAASAAAVDAHHDPGPRSRVRIGLAPCSPFSVSADLLVESARLARGAGVRLHTHLAETRDEDDYCREHFGCSPVDHLQKLGWLGDDVWFAHGIHFDDTGIRELAASGTGVAHCPSSNARLGAGICRTRDLRDAGVPVGLGVDGAASNEAGSLVEEARQALLLARARGGPEALTVRDALETATIGGARVLGWDDRIGSLEPGKEADVAVWRLDTLPHADIVDPVAALVLGTRPPLELLLVAGRPVVERDRLVTAHEQALAAEVVRRQRALLGNG
ncbi:MAG TPA: 8-oxoguanine deaminase [Nocardioides sp.]|uniref:8-oxoguanine deaminase n=1 Tax=Nocardioides sp. TaxID=35761 RepID=UPI002E32733C|nr:8-oxoguanine deaminase [Nocardioides sp.]HEX5089291.1 8-oxoguanine deaminase [Nocardioides sp.]